MTDSERAAIRAQAFKEAAEKMRAESRRQSQFGGPHRAHAAGVLDALADSISPLSIEAAAAKGQSQ